MKYSLYNVVWYDGVDAYVTKFILKSNKEDAKYDLLDFWTKRGFDGRFLELDELYIVNFDNIIAFSNGDNEQKRALEYFKEMYF